MARKQLKQKQKIHPITYLLLLIFIALFTAVIILSLPNKKYEFANRVSVQLSKQDLKQVSQEDKNIFYLDRKESKFNEVSVNSLYNLVQNSKDLFLVYTGNLNNVETLKQFGVINKVFSAFTNKDYKLTGSDINIQVNEKLQKATNQKIYFLNTLDSKIEYKNELVSYNNFEKLEELGLTKDPKSLPTILVFYNGKYIKLDLDHRFSVIGGKTAQDYIINFRKFLNETIVKEVLK